MRCPKCKESLKEGKLTCQCGYKLSFKYVPPPPKQQGSVNDYEGILTGEHYEKTRRLITDFEKKTGIEIVVVIMNNTKPLLPENYAFYLFNRWKLGGKKHEAILILVSMLEKRIETEIGYGLEKIISEEYTEKLLDQIMVPYFKQSKYGDGLYEGIKDVAREVQERLNLK